MNTAENFMRSITIGIILVLLFSQGLTAQDSNRNLPEDNINEIKKRGYSVDACYRIAEDYFRTSTEQIKAIPYLEYVIESKPDIEPRAYQMLATSYYYYGRFDKAIELISSYISKEKSRYLIRIAKQDLEKYKNAKRIASSPINANLINLGTDINSPQDEINPFISKKENLMVYSSNRSDNFNVYVSKKDINTSTWSRAKLAGKYINTANDEYVAGLSPSGKNLFIHYNQYNGFEDINFSVREKGLYRELADLGTKVNSIYKEEGACISSGGDTLYFSSNRPGGYGGFDLYYSLRLPDGTFGSPFNMGETVNSHLDDNYPNLSPDGKRLYFASKGHNSIGGYDIFYTSLNIETMKWSTPKNIGYPLNNAYDNKSIAFTSDPRYAYISTIDWRTNGNYDIYKVVFLDEEPSYLIVKTEFYCYDGESDIELGDENNNLEISVYQGKQLFGKYTYNKRNNSIIMALQPGTYLIEIKSENFKPYRRKIIIKENLYINNIRTLKIRLEKK